MLLPFLALMAIGLCGVRPAASTSARAPAPSPVPGDLIINEFQPWPEAPASEFVEILNRSARTILVESIGVSDDRLFTAGATAVRPIPVPPGGLSMAPGDLLVVVADLARFHANYPGVPAIEVPGWPALNNGGDSVVLIADEAVVDAVTYSGSWRQGAASVERVDPRASSEVPDNWVASSDPSGGTPGRQNSGYDPDRAPPRVLFAEQQSPSALRIRFNEPVRAAGSSELRVLTDPPVPCGPADADSGPQEFRFRCDALEEVQGIRVPAVTDGVGNVMPDTTVLLARLPRPGDLVVNEIHFDPLSDDYDGLPNQPEFVEVLNTSERQIAVRTCMLADQRDESGRSTILPFATDFSLLDASSVGVLVADPASVHPNASALLDEAFPARATSEASATWVVSRASLGLSNAGEPIRIVCDGVMIDSVNYAPAWHHPALVDTKGRSLERRSATGPSNVSWNWSTSTADAGATPGHHNTIRTDVQGQPSPDRERTGAVLFTPDGDGRDDVAVLPVPVGDDGLLLRAIVFDLRGRPVRILEAGRFAGKDARVIWDGRDDSGRDLDVGAYVVWTEGVEGRSGRVLRDRMVVVLSRPGGR